MISSEIILINIQLFSMIKKIYNKIYSKSPKSIQGNLSKIAFKLDNKPTVKFQRTMYSRMEQKEVCNFCRL